MLKNRLILEMRYFIGIVVFTLLSIQSATAQDAATFIKDGRQLSNQKQYAQAIEKYKNALAIEPENVQANYQLAFTLFASGKGPEGLLTLLRL
jgi:tetratricopeptide (TPR) repeat protein